MTLSPESQWLLALARVHIDPDLADRLRELTTQVDWTRFVDLALRHGLGPLVSRNLNWLGWPNVPPLERERLQAHAIATSLWNRRLARELVRIVRHFRAKGIRVFALKGPTLAVAAYGDLSTRSFTDLDICVHPAGIHQALEALVADGYQPEANIAAFTARQRQAYYERGYHIGLSSPKSKLCVELHWALTPPHHDWRFDVASAFDRLAEVEIEGERIPTLCTAELLPYLCVHGAKHCWERLEWVCGVAELVRQSRDLNWPALLEQSRRQGGERLLLAGLLLAQQLLDVSTPAIVTERLCVQQLGSEFVEQVRHRLFAATTPIWSYERHLLYLHLRESWRDKVRYAWYLLGKLPRHALKLVGLR